MMRRLLTGILSSEAKDGRMLAFWGDGMVQGRNVAK
jgi:hypothetical protein